MIHNLSSYTLGLVFIFFVAIIWSAASILVQYLYQDLDFDDPFLLTYIGTSLFVVLIPIHRLYERWVEAHQGRHLGRNVLGTILSSSDNTNGTGRADYTHIATPSSSEEGEMQEPQHHQHNHWTERDHVIAAAKIAPFWFISNFAYNASLQYTSITSSTVLVNTGSLFTFLFALWMRDERFSCWKLLGVIFGISGTIITGMHDVSSSGDGTSSGDDGRRQLIERYLADVNSHLLWGDILSVFSAVFYGVYAVMVRVLCPRDESLMSMQLFLGYVGLWNGVVLSPVAIWKLGIAKSVTISALVLGCLVIKGLFDNVLSDYLWARSVVLTSATVATVGLGLTIPLAFVSDIFMGRENVVNFESVVGALAVLTGFILVNVGQQQEEEEDEHEHSPPQQQEVNHADGEVFSRSTGASDQGEGTASITHAPDQAIHHMSIDASTSGPYGFKDEVL